STTRGDIACDTVISATAGWSTLVADLAAVKLPITTHILQAFVTEPVKPFLDVVIVSSQMHVYISQTDRGEFLIGAEIEPYTTYKGTGTFPFLEYSARHVLELFPQLERVKVLRSWTGLCDLSPDYSPILGRTELESFHISTGWGTYGVKVAPIVGTSLAERFGMSWRFWHASQRKRLGILVSRYEHCLLDLLWRWRSGDLDVDIVHVVSNHPDLRPDVRVFSLPYTHVPVEKDNKREA